MTRTSKSSLAREAAGRGAGCGGPPAPGAQETGYYFIRAKRPHHTTGRVMEFAARLYFDEWPDTRLYHCTYPGGACKLAVTTTTTGVCADGWEVLEFRMIDRQEYIARLPKYA